MRPGFIKLEITRNDDRYEVALTKGFAEEHGGGKQTFFEDGGTNIHGALDVARGMVTVSNARRSDFELLKQLEEAQRELYELAGEPIGSGRYRQIDEAIKLAKGI